MWLVLLVINTIVVVSLALYWNFATELRKFKRQLEFSKIVPGPSIIETLSNIRKDRVFDWTLELRNRYGRLFRIWLSTDLILFITDPDDLRTVLTSNELLYKADGYKFLEPWLGNGLLTNGGSDWHRRRKMLTPAFHFKILSAFQKPLEDNCKILIQKLKDASANGKANINIYPYISLFTLDAICETAMGVKRQAQLNSDSAYVKAVQKICEVVQNRALSSWRKYEFLYQFTSDAREGRNALRILHNETKKVIEQRRKLLEQESDVTLHKIENDDTFNTKRRFAFLDILLIEQKEGVTITDKEIREEVDTFMFEGHDTTSSAISFTIYLLSQHPEIQEKAYQEIIQSNGQDKEQMKYLEAVIKESLRLYPPVPSFSRTTQGDFKLGDITIPEGTTLTILSYVAHRNSKEYPDPEKFMPERYLEGSKQFHPFSSIAFSAGPRNCIGQRFAMLELKCTLTNLLRNFEFLPADNFVVKPIAQLVMKGSDGILVKIRPRKKET